MAKITEEALDELEALALPGPQRAELLEPLKVRLFAHVQRRDAPRAARMLMKLNGWPLLPTLKKKVADFIKDAEGALKKERDEQELAERLEAARNAERPLIAVGKPVKIAESFRAALMPRLLYFNSEWLTYEVNQYVPMEERHVRATLQSYCSLAVNEENGEDYDPTRRDLDDIMDALKNNSFKGKTEITLPAWLEEDGTEPPAKLTLACRNGLLDMRKLDLMRPSWTFFTRNGLEYDYNPEAECPLWIEFLHKTWPDEPEAHEALREMFAYILTGETSFQKIFMIVGPTRSGKGTINLVLSRLVGMANVVSKSLKALKSEFGLSDLVGKSLLTVTDMRLDKGAPTGHLVELLLQISGEDPVNINIKFKDPYTGKVNARIVLYGNMELALPDIAGALAGRLVPIRMTRSWLGKEDRSLQDKLLAELPGILNWALGGVTPLFDRGQFVLTPGGQKVLDHIMMKASPVLAFLRECCDDTRGEAIPVKTLLGSFDGWQRERGLDPWRDEHKFMEEVRTAFPLTETTRRAFGGKKLLAFTNLTLKPEFMGRVWETDEGDDEDDDL